MDCDQCDFVAEGSCLDIKHCQSGGLECENGEVPPPDDGTNCLVNLAYKKLVLKSTLLVTHMANKTSHQRKDFQRGFENVQNLASGNCTSEKLKDQKIGFLNQRFPKNI